eukprot:6190857-Pleurochrysis_carterae.AAC.1
MCELDKSRVPNKAWPDKKEVVDFQKVQSRKSPRDARTGREGMRVKERARLEVVVGVDVVPRERSDTQEQQQEEREPRRPRRSIRDDS